MPLYGVDALVLAFAINTRYDKGDHLATPAGLRSWLHLQADRLPEPVPDALSAADLEAVLAVRRHTPYGARLAAHLAEAAADLLTDPKADRVRACEAADCVMLFQPAHPRRRWCSAARCGNRGPRGPVLRAPQGLLTGTRPRRGRVRACGRR
jgi:hypothetical protein